MARSANDANTLYRKHKRLLYERAHYWHKVTGQPVGDLLGACHKAFMDAARRYDPRRGAFTTLLRRCCDNAIKSHCQRWPPPVDDEALLEQDSCCESPRARAAWRGFIDGLAGEAREAIEVLFACPEELWKELAGRPCEPKHIRQALRKVLLRKGWRPSSIRSAYTAIRTGLKKERGRL